MIDVFDLVLDYDTVFIDFRDDYFWDYIKDEVAKSISSREENPLSYYDMYYNKDKQTFVIKDDEKTTIVKKCSEDKEDIEKAMLYAILKHNGITPKMVNEQLKNVRIQSKKKVKKWENLREFI